MNTNHIASELLVLAKELLGMDFPTQKALDKYLKEHPGGSGANHRVIRPHGSPEFRRVKPIGNPTNIQDWNQRYDEQHKKDRDWNQMVEDLHKPIPFVKG